eukprot:1861212-Pyramimonas_sp.AAC.1
MSNSSAGAENSGRAGVEEYPGEASKGQRKRHDEAARRRYSADKAATRAWRMSWSVRTAAIHYGGRANRNARLSNGLLT